MAYSANIGDAQPAAEAVDVASLPLARETVVNLADEDAAINNANISGKKLGATVFAVDTGGEVDIAVASGSGVNDTWVLVSGFSQVSDLTLTVAGDVGDAAGITTQMNLIENAFNSLIGGAVITPA